MSDLPENIKKIIEQLNTETQISMFIERYSKVLDSMEANAVLEKEVLTKINKVLDIYLK